MRIAMLTLVALPLTLASCGSRQDPAPVTGQQAQPVPVGQQGMQGQQPQQPGMATAGCPMEMQGAMISAQDVEEGAALVFTTQGDVQQLRSSVSQMVDQHNQRHASMAHHGQLPPSQARVEEVQGGARVVFTPQDQNDLAPLRAEVRQHAQQMAAGDCPMMREQPTAAR